MNEMDETHDYVTFPMAPSDRVLYEWMSFGRWAATVLHQI